ncbi:ACT domain-containing protein [Actinoplanes sp. NEAU-A12]|uniref:ACT domain-containing protein n=1 Tax=Actinoplanes sandaracinus TaxID=3045177 RepID=A0ABT6X1V2_9ACTN|nr:ACT domain-containing protein [Actinoplanes sandaracinus]MDI6105991.1 ACT domain-containing protein [Actinoplanes sandaracinus]
MTSDRVQRLRFLPGHFAVTLDERGGTPPGDEWLALVRGPEGLTVIRPAAPGDREQWRALYSGDTAHDLDVPGMLNAVLTPLARAAVPVFVASTFHADLVLVPVEQSDRAAEVLRAAGHHVTTAEPGDH